MKTKRKDMFSVWWLVLVIAGLVIISGPAAFAEPRSGGAYYNYGEAMQKAILFYKYQRSGDLPDDYILHNRGDSCMNDGADVGLDLTGGWYDAGDHVKFGHPMAYAAAQLAWAVYEYRSAFEASGQLDDILDEIKWATDYFIKCHPSANVYYYNCGYGESDHSIWCPPEVVDQFTERTSFKVDETTPGSDVASMASSALTLASLIFESTDPAYAATCLTHAQQLFTFADTYQGKNPLDNFYQSGGYLDDLMWAAIWLYIKTGDTTYLDKSKSYVPTTSLGGHWTHCWDDVTYGATLKIAQASGDAEYARLVEVNLDWWQPGSGMTYTPDGLAWLDNWGSLRYASTAAFLAFVWADDTTVGTLSKKEMYRAFAERMINYALGDNARAGSYVVGFGTNAPVHPHHRTTHCSWLSQLTVPAFHRHILYGALCGGPSQDGSYVDDIADYTRNEVTDDYNAGFVGALARMYALYGGTPLSNFPTADDLHPPEGVLKEYFCRGWISWEGPNDLDILMQINNRSACPAKVRTGMYARYFVDLSEVFDAGYSLSDVTVKIQAGDAGGTVSALTLWSGTIYYFTYDFTGTKIHPGGWDICEKEGVIRLHSPVSGGNTNDWSYQLINSNPDYDCKTFTGIDDNIPVYDNGVLLYGNEPGTSGETAAPTTPPTVTDAPTIAPTANPTTPPADTIGPTDLPTATPAPTDTPAPTAIPTATPYGVTADPTTPPTVTDIPTTPPSVTDAPAVTVVPTTPPAETTAPGGCTCTNLCTSQTAITVPFTKDGSGEFCYTSSSLGTYVNSWNADAVNVNGTNCTNTYTASSSIAAISGVYYIYYKGSYSWSHLEIK